MSTKLPSLVPLIGPPKWNRKFTSSDIKPKELISVVEESTSGSSDVKDDEPNYPLNSLCVNANTRTPNILCPTCKKNVARYSCPKCSAPYCGLDCYKRHDVWDQSRDKGEGKGTEEVSGGQCTEAFYRDRVVSINQLDVKSEENKKQMLNILARSKDEKFNLSEEESLVHSNETVEKETDLTEEEWSQLARHVMQMDLDCEDETEGKYSEDDNGAGNDEDSSDLIFSSLPDAIRHKFELAVQKGHASPLIQEWHPFWMPEYKSQSPTKNVSLIEKQPIEYMYDHVSVRTSEETRTIDERILNLRQFSSVSNSSKPRINLHHNTLEILFVGAHILRFYNGLESLEKETSSLLEDASIQEAAVDLYTQCQVLAQDARWGSTQEVLMHVQCSDICNRPLKRVDSSDSQRLRSSTFVNSKATLTTVIRDLIAISKHRRLVLRVLFRVLDILTVGYKCMRDKNGTGKSADDSTRFSSKKLKLASKKVEYFCSWVHLNWDEVKEDMLGELEDWLERYDLNDKIELGD